MSLTFENLLISCLQIGLKMEDFLKLKVGTILDIITARSNMMYEEKLRAEKIKEERNNKEEKVRMATKNDNIMSFF